jgi:hypothetical protein
MCCCCHVDGVRSCLWTEPPTGFCSHPRWYMSMESHVKKIMTGENRTTWRKTWPSVTLSTTNPTRTDPGSNPGLRVEGPGTNRLNHGTALLYDCLLPVSFRTRLACKVKGGGSVNLQYVFWWQSALEKFLIPGHRCPPLIRLWSCATQVKGLYGNHLQSFAYNIKHLWDQKLESLYSVM